MRDYSYDDEEMTTKEMIVQALAAFCGTLVVGGGGLAYLMWVI